MQEKNVGKGKTLAVFIVTIVAGFVLFILPNLFFGITKINGGLTGINLLFTAVFQVVTVTLLVYFSLRVLNKDFSDIGWSSQHWQRDSLLGLGVGLLWTILQFAWIIPSTGGAARNDVAGMVETFDGSVIGLISYVALGVIGGGIAEEIYNRGYFISVLKELFDNPQVGIWVAAVLSVLFFALGHLPSNGLEWFDILVPTIAYTILFVLTKRLTAPIVAHGIYNLSAILLTYAIYYL